ncbi:hypothetical protein [Xylella fastidiosa]|uniref:Uncharacterized protein n=1 Tax=Xylella fastidiosa (strain 9a5c) TaxID=160492 RepID=Q9PHF9_XYLFA|nr:hypothetical protein [Xylella fastidiosa]AAF85617.1 hypothetical protein XF_a0049 [Xylella fastidiosa 9a5c]KXB10306.1 hypothetical protein ADT29_00035 [Xylella fastidiosa]KXB17487.1 hypothetical protein ADT30_00345 [Xylella fastidiosa]KXB18611.1 hypothetical protein ADT28_00035 [Xylella fastidiosa]
MDRKAIAERLRALASDDKNRSKTARLRDVIDDVEAALSAGVPRSSVLNELEAQGLQMSIATFETTLRRIRQKRRKLQISSVIPSQGQPEKPRETLTPVISSHHPTDLDKIIGSKPDLAALAKLAKRKQK